MYKLKYIIATAISAILISIVWLSGLSVSAEWVNKGYFGDLDLDGDLSASDTDALNKFLVGKQKIDVEDGTLRADLNKDGKINVFDFILLKRSIKENKREEIWVEVTEPVMTTIIPAVTANITSETTQSTTETTVTTTEQTIAEEFVNAPIKKVNASLPSQGEARVVIFYVDFPDCRYKQNLTEEDLQKIAFGAEDEKNKNYPFESLSAFYSRSSKNTMKLDGQVFRYTAKDSVTAYSMDKIKMAEECYNAFDDKVDFSRFDANNDGRIDATIFTVPTEAGNLYWWPCSGVFGDPAYVIDGMSVGSIVTGNAEIDNKNKYVDFTSSYLHELGHCMGIPDYYLYYSEDYDGMHGNAGTELMDLDAASDFGCFSKLMLGWYKHNQISVYEGGTQEYILSNAQTDDGNCVIIPYGQLDENYFSEYFIIEYITSQYNNSYVNSHMGWWQNVGNGIRIYHVKADLQEDFWFNYFRYQNGSIYTGYDDNGVRLLRLVNDAEGGNVFKTGMVIDSSISGFNWYDENELEAIDPEISINVGELSDGKYTITVSEKNNIQ